MTTVKELRIKAEQFKKKEDFKNALSVFREIWDKEKSDWNGYYLAQCLRKTNNFLESREFCNYIKAAYPYFKPIINEELWLDYSEKIKSKENSNILNDAENLLAKTNKYDKYTGSIFNKTVLTVVRHLVSQNNNLLTLTWLDKLDFTTLNNIPFTFKGQKYASDQKTFFVYYADVLVTLDKHIDYISSCLSCLRVEGKKQDQFLKYIIDSITYIKYNYIYRYGVRIDFPSTEEITRLKLALYLKYFYEEINNRIKGNFKIIFNPKKITLISDLGHFVFCPVSFSINETYNIDSNELWEKDEWLGEKRCLLNRYNDFQKVKNISEAFKDTTIEINEKLNDDFNEIFYSKIITNNLEDVNKMYYSNPTDTIRGNPDYIFENINGKRYAVIEKFTRKDSNESLKAFDNDLVKCYGYIFEFPILNLDFSYLIYWYWDFHDIKDDREKIIKKIRIKSYRIFRIEKTDENKNKLAIVLDKLDKFKLKGKHGIDGDKISYPNKCLNCSVVSYCNHKTGKFNIIDLPYDISAITLNGKPTIDNSSQYAD